MKSTPLFIGCFALAAMVPLACRDNDSNAKLQGVVDCVGIESTYSTNSQIAGLNISNRCGRDLDFSEATIQFSGATPQSQPWGQYPEGFSWMAWQVAGNGFSFKKDPGATWVRVNLQNGQTLRLQFNANGQPQNAKLILGGGYTPDPKPDPTPDPKPDPTPDPKPDPKPDPNPGKKEIVAYYQTWSAGWAGSGDQHSLAKLPPYITTVLLSFARPEASYYAGQNSWSGTGLDFSSNFDVVRDAIRTLHARNPGTKVLLSVGGATYTNWASANANSIAALVRDLGADGADLDYEPTTGVCSWGTGGNSCPNDQEFIRIIRNFRAALPRPYLITTAGWSTGAFGPGEYAASNFNGNLIGGNFGLYVNPLKQVGDMFDAIYIMSYDAGGPQAPSGTPTGYDPKKAFNAYRKIYKGPLMLGVEVPPEAWGGHVSTPEEAQARAQYVIDHGGNGMMIWSIQKAGNPTSTAFVQAMCRTLNLPSCDRTLP